MIQLDGKDGGGQILRTALSLSMITGQSFHLKNIRGKRPKPGLMRQHLTCVMAAAEICDAATDGAELKSTELIFKPGKIKAGDYHFKIGTAGSTTLLAQTLLPALWRADGPSTLRLEGGTHNPMAPPAHFLERVFLPAVSKMGFHATCELVRYGFAPSGGGEIFLKVEPAGELQSLDLCERGEMVSQSITATLAHIPATIGEREIRAALSVMEWPEECAGIVEAETSAGAGNCFSVEIAFDHVSEQITTFGGTNRRAEDVGKDAAKRLGGYLKTGAVVGRCLADQLLLPMALAGGGKFITMTPSNHCQTNGEVIRAFLPVQFGHRIKSERSHLIEIF
jgi:RNA 3'-terminal phosphate cyclase (ATP)